MSYVALHFDVDADAVERWSELLLGAGAQSIDVADPHEGTIDESPLYDESGGDAPQWWPVSRITALFGGARELDQALNALAADARTLPPHETYPVQDRDWVRAGAPSAGRRSSSALPAATPARRTAAWR